MSPSKVHFDLRRSENNENLPSQSLHWTRHEWQTPFCKYVLRYLTFVPAPPPTCMNIQQWLDLVGKTKPSRGDTWKRVWGQNDDRESKFYLWKRKSTPTFTKSPSLVFIRQVFTEIQRFKDLKIYKEMYGHPDALSDSVLMATYFFLNFDIFKWLHLSYYWIYLHQTWGFSKTWSTLYDYVDQ